MTTPAAALRSHAPDARTSRSTTTTTWYTVFPGGCVTARLRAENPADTALVTEAASIVGFATRHALQEALDQRSNGRLQLDHGRQG